MKWSDEVDLKRFVPKRIRTLMIANIVIAIAITVFLGYREPIIAGSYLLVQVAMFVTVATVVITAVSSPLVLVEYYLYRRGKGIYFQWTASPPPRHRDTTVRPHFRRVRRPLEELEIATIGQTQLFQSAPPTDPVSRAALLLKVADKLAASGKKEAARTCYRQILERFTGEPEAQVASLRLQEPTAAGRMI